MTSDHEEKITWQGPEFVDLSNLLANLFYLRDDIIPIVRRAGVRPGKVNFTGTSSSIWMSALEEARRMGQIDAVIDSALEEYPNEDALMRARAGTPLKTPRATEPDEWRGPKTVVEYQRLMHGRSTLVPVRYLERGMTRARAIVRIVTDDGGTGTGFLTDTNLLITNYHVLTGRDQARSAVIWFNYEENADQTTAEVTEAKLDLDKFWMADADDDISAWTFSKDMTADWGGLALAKTSVVKGDRVNIIQHPMGAFKQLSVAADLIADVRDDRIQYLTDTQEGSSGAPVFDKYWNLVAVHQAVVREVADGADLGAHRNQGIPVGRLIDKLGKACRLNGG